MYKNKQQGLILHEANDFFQNRNARATIKERRQSIKIQGMLNRPRSDIIITDQKHKKEE